MKNLFKKSLLALVMAGFIFNANAMKRPAPGNDINPNPEKKHQIELSDSDLQSFANEFAENIKSILTSDKPDDNSEFKNIHLRLMEHIDTLPQEKIDIVEKSIKDQWQALSTDLIINCFLKFLYCRLAQ